MFDLIEILLVLATTSIDSRRLSVFYWAQDLGKSTSGTGAVLSAAAGLDCSLQLAL